nr:hypothetical protein [Fodinicola feengrottensis]
MAAILSASSSRASERRQPLPQLLEVPDVGVEARVLNAEAAGQRGHRHVLEADLVGQLRGSLGEPLRGQASSCHASPS